MKKILIVEDDAVLGGVLFQKLQAAGFDTKLVRDGAEGFIQIGDWRPDVLVLDLFLPLLNGFEILEQKKKDSRISGIPVIVLTNSLHPTNSAQIEGLGVASFMVKSDVTTEHIVESVKKLLKESETQPVLASKGLGGKKILLVEDDSFLSSILLSRLNSEKVLASYAKTGELALEELKKQIPDAVLLDVLLPGINGFDVLQSIRENPATKDLPVIIISNFSQAKDLERAKSMGASYIVKALANPDDILKQVEKMLEGK